MEPFLGLGRSEYVDYQKSSRQLKGTVSTMQVVPGPSLVLMLMRCIHHVLVYDLMQHTVAALVMHSCVTGEACC